MGRQLWEGIRTGRSYQRFLYGVGAVLIASGIVHLGVQAVDGGAWHGAVSWRKPVVFGLSFGVSAWAVGWVLGQLPARRVLGWSVAGALGVASLVEVGLITLQRWRGVPSHFNLATSFDGAVFSLMGTSVAVVAVAILAALGWALLGLRRSPVAWWTSVVGLGLMLAGSGIGGQMIARGHAVLEATGQVPEGILFGPAGSAKLAHAAGLHGIQVLIGLAVVLGLGTLTPATQRRLVRAAAVAYTVLFAVVTLQAYAGRSPLDLGPLLAAAGAIAVVVLVGVGVVAVRSWVATAAATDPDPAPAPA